MASVEELRDRCERPVELDESPAGKLRLSAVTKEVASFITDLLESKASDRTFTEQLVQHLAEEPELDLVTIAKWTDEELLAVALAWVEEIHKRHGRKYDKGASFAGLEKALKRYLSPLFDTAAERLANIAGAPALGDFTASKVADALGYTERNILASGLGKSWGADLNSSVIGAGWLEALQAGEEYRRVTDLLGPQSPLLEDIAAASKLAQQVNDSVGIGYTKHLDEFLKSNAAELLEQQNKMVDLVGSFGSSALVNEAFLKASTEAAPFFEAVRADELLYGHLAEPLSSATEFARAVSDIERLWPAVEVPESVFNVAENFKAMEELWSGSVWDTVRASAPILDSAVALFEQDWILNSATWDLVAELRVEGDAQAVLSEHGFGFTVLHLLEWATLRLLADRHGQEKSSALIVRRLTLESQKESFRQGLGEMFQQMSTLPRKVRDLVKPRSRWRAVDQALDAHSRRHYYTSVPVLIAQVDGLLTCLLVARGELWPSIDNWGKKIYKGLDLSKPGAVPITANSLRKRLKCTTLQTDPMLAELIEVLETRLDDRNGVLHGDDTEYGNAKLSSQMVWALAALAFQLAIIAEAYSRARGAKRAG